MTVPMIASVAAALPALGRRKLGTPLLTASTPVSAVQPDENARSASPRTRRPDTWCSGVMAKPADSAVGASPVAICHAPTTIISSTVAMNP